MSPCDLDLWPVDLESSWYIQCHVIKVFTKFARNRAIRDELLILRIFAHVMSRMTLTFDLLTLNFYNNSGVLRLNSVHSLSEIE